MISKDRIDEFFDNEYVTKLMGNFGKENTIEEKLLNESIIEVFNEYKETKFVDNFISINKKMAYSLYDSLKNSKDLSKNKILEKERDFISFVLYRDIDVLKEKLLPDEILNYLNDIMNKRIFNENGNFQFNLNSMVIEYPEFGMQIPDISILVRKIFARFEKKNLEIKNDISLKGDKYYEKINAYLKRALYVHNEDKIKDLLINSVIDYYFNDKYNKIDNNHYNQALEVIVKSNKDLLSIFSTILYNKKEIQLNNIVNQALEQKDYKALCYLYEISNEEQMKVLKGNIFEKILINNEDKKAVVELQNHSFFKINKIRNLCKEIVLVKDKLILRENLKQLKNGEDVLDIKDCVQKVFVVKQKQIQKLTSKIKEVSKLSSNSFKIFTYYDEYYFIINTDLSDVLTIKEVSKAISSVLYDIEMFNINNPAEKLPMVLREILLNKVIKEEEESNPSLSSIKTKRKI